MSDPIFWHRLQFGFTAAYHYLFPQLTMGLGAVHRSAEGAGPPHRQGRQ
jgi:cytochrome bd-type quinol oxidase subunit 1